MSGYWRSKKVVVTGGAGLVGSHLCDLLVDAGARLRVVDDLSKGIASRLEHLQGKLEFIQGDLCDPAVAQDAFRDQDVVMHLASRAYGIEYSRDHHDEMLEFNRRLNSTVLKACVDRKVPRVCVISSSCVYPDDAPSPTPELPVMTGEPEKANVGYGWAKRHLEIEAQELSKKHGFDLAIVRPFNAYSGRYKWEGQYSHVIPMIVKRILDGENPLVIWGTGRQRRNFLHAIDFSRCFMGVTEHYATGDPVNVGYEETVTIPEIADIVCGIAGLKLEYRFDASKPEGRLVKSADSTKLRKVTGGIRPTVPLADGLREMVGWYERTFKGRTGVR
jgi:nucleoside-diphosphate-sugar epimerase